MEFKDNDTYEAELRIFKARGNFWMAVAVLALLSHIIW